MSRAADPHRPFMVERRAIPLKADLETKFQLGLDVVRAERSAAASAARVDSVLAVLKGEPQAVQEGVMAGLKAMLGRQYVKASTARKMGRAPSPRETADSVFAKQGEAA